jgi:hypothetical protein
MNYARIEIPLLQFALNLEVDFECPAGVRFPQTPKYY